MNERDLIFQGLACSKFFLDCFSSQSLSLPNQCQFNLLWFFLFYYSSKFFSYLLFLVLYFSVAPKIETDKPLEPTRTLKAGASLSQHFNIYGVPAPSVAWTLNGAPLDPTLYTSAPESSALGVKGVTGRQGGKYEVTATNEVGSTSATFSVVVLGECDVTTCSVLYVL